MYFSDDICKERNERTRHFEFVLQFLSSVALGYLCSARAEIKLTKNTSNERERTAINEQTLHT